MPHKKQSMDIEHPIGYGKNEQHLGKAKITDHREASGPQAGVHGEEESRVCGQAGPELLGGSASPRVLGQSIDEQLVKPLPATDEY